LVHLLRNIMNSWDDLRGIFTGNFQGTFVRSGNPWDLKGCGQKPGESLRNYIRHFSQNYIRHHLGVLGWHAMPYLGSQAWLRAANNYHGAAQHRNPTHLS
jgi:hypothetical protein